MVTAGQAAKDKGNAAFKAGDYPAAVGHYSSATIADPSNPTYPLNRAAAYLKLGKNEDAERDCSLVLKLDTRNVKALFRRAQARVVLQKLQDAQADLKQALTIEPANDAIKQELRRVDDSLQKEQCKPRAKRQPLDVPSTPRPTSTASTSAPIPALTAPKRRRVPITIVEAPPTASTSGSTTPKPGPSKVAPTPAAAPDDLMTSVSSRPLAGSPALTPSAPKQPATFKEAKEARESARPRPGGGIFRKDGSHILFGAKEKGNTMVPMHPGSAVDDRPAPGFSPYASNPQSPPAHEEPPANVQVPPTLFAFTRQWEDAQTAEERWALLSAIPPAALPVFFRASLEAPMLSAIVGTLRAALPACGVEVHAYLQALARVPRFGTIALFMSDDERTRAREVWDIADADGADAARRAWGL